MEYHSVLYLEIKPYFIEIQSNTHSIVSVSFVENIGKNSANISEINLRCADQLKEYFEGNRTDFDLKLDPKGTDFQKRVWGKLLEIPYGKTTSYAQMAHKLNDPLVIRAAASANGKNPIAIIIPCHRVIGSDGSMTGYAGGIDKKRYLLNLEKANGILELF